MKISVGTDHRGLEQKQMVAQIASDLGHSVVDHGTNSTESCDYPDIAKGAGDIGRLRSDRSRHLDLRHWDRYVDRS